MPRKRSEAEKEAHRSRMNAWYAALSDEDRKALSNRRRKYHVRYLAKLRADPERLAGLREKQNQASQNQRDRAAQSRATWLRYRLVDVRARATKNGIPFDLAVLPTIALPDHCPITGWLLKYGVRGNDKCAASLDRLIPALGYAPGNVRIICRYANTIRQDCLDPAVFFALALDAERLQCQTPD